MIVLPRFPRAPRSFGIAATALVLAASAAACGSTPKDVWFLGPVDTDAGQPDAAPESAPTPPQPANLTVSACSAGALVGADEASVVRSISLLGDRAIIASANVLSAWSTDDTGCPVGRVGTFGDSGEVALDASSAAAVPGGRAIAATADSTVLLSATGEIVGLNPDTGEIDSPCQLAGADIIARNVTIRADGKGVAVFARSPLYPISTDLAWPEACDVSTLALIPEPFAVATAARQGDGWVTVEQRLASSPLVVSWYDTNGNQLATSEAWAADGEPGHLCSATSIVTTDSSVIVADAACRSLVTFDSKTHDPVGRAVFDGTPRGVTLTSAGDALVAIARPIGDGAVATFAIVKLQ